MPISGLLSALAKHSYIPARLSKTITDEHSVLLVDGGALKHRLWRDCGAPQLGVLLRIYVHLFEI